MDIPAALAGLTVFFQYHGKEEIRNGTRSQRLNECFGWQDVL